MEEMKQQLSILKQQLENDSSKTSKIVEENHELKENVKNLTKIKDEHHQKNKGLMSSLS